MKAPRPPGLLVLAVLVLHLLLGAEVQRLHEGWLQEAALPPPPPRMQVDFVREMTLSAPVAPVAPAAHAAARPRAAPRPEPVPAAAAPAASDASPEALAETSPAASAPDAVDGEATAPVAAAASEAMTAAPPSPGASSVPADQPGPEWPLSTRLSYLLTGHFRGPLNGTAQVEWLRQGRDYQVHLDVNLGLVSRRMSSQGLLTPEGIAPQRYDEETKLPLMDPRRARVLFEPGAVQLTTGVREPVLRGAQDSASQFVQLTWLFLTGREPLQAGHAVRFPLVLPRRQYAWQYDVVGEELIETPLGALSTWHLKPARAPAAGDLLAEVWLAPSLQYLPVRILIRQDAETHIDLVLRRAPLQAAPESAASGHPRRP